MIVFVHLALLSAAAAQSALPVSGGEGPQKSPVQVIRSGSFPPSPVGSGTPATGNAKVPQLSVADILALRRAVQQRQLLSRSGVVSPTPGRLQHPYGYNFAGDSVRAQFADLSGPGSSFGDYLASGSAPPPKVVKPSISTRFRSFMNSLFFRSSSSVAPAFYQPAQATLYRPGPASFLPQPAQQPRIPQDFSSKSSAGFPTSYGAVSNKPVKPDFSAASLPSKPSFVPSYSSSVSSSVSSSPSSPSKTSSIVSPISSASNPHASVATASGFYPSISSSSSSSYDKYRFSSLYGSNGFTAKASPVKSSKSIKTHLPSGASDEKFPEAAGPTLQKPSQQQPQPLPLQPSPPESSKN